MKGETHQAERRIKNKVGALVLRLLLILLPKWSILLASTDDDDGG